MTHIDRREFLKRNAFGIGGIALTLQESGKAISKNDIINIGIIGSGRHGRWTMNVLKALPNIKMIACCDILPEHLNKALEIAEEGAVGYKDYRKLLENKDIDAVLIATPLSLHYQISVDALSSGKHVYCEKTMTYNIDQAVKLVKAVKAQKKIFMVGYQMRLNPLFSKVKEMLDVDYLGTLTHVYCNYNRNADWRREVKNPEHERIINWRMYREYSVGLMAELCSHHIDLVNMILSNHPIKVCGFGGIDYWQDGRETYDNVHALYTYPKGIKAVFSSLTTNAFLAIRLQFLGTEGTIVVDSNKGSKPIYYPEGRVIENSVKKVETDSLDTVTSATMQAFKHGKGVPIEVEGQAKDEGDNKIMAFAHFADCIYHNRTPNSNVESGRQSSITVHMADLAMRNGTVEQWKPEYSS